MPGNENAVHGYAQDAAEGVEVVYGRKGFTALPFVDGLGFFKAEEALQIPDSQAAFLTETDDVLAGGDEVDYRKRLL